MDDHAILYVHGIGKHPPDFSTSWFESLEPHLSGPVSRKEVIWSDIVNTTTRSAMISAMHENQIMANTKAAIEEVMLDRMLQKLPASEPGSSTMSPLQLRSFLTNPIDDFVFYMFNSFLREQILSRFESAVSNLLNDGFVVHVIAHSWGSVVAFEGLKRLETHALPENNGSFFTLGSALSLSPVQTNLFQRIANGDKPELVNYWSNVDAAWDFVGGRIGGVFEVDEDLLDLQPIGCDGFFGIVNPVCAHSSYFHIDNKKVQKTIVAKQINSQLQSV
jgi:hypothetical protein